MGTGDPIFRGTAQCFTHVARGDRVRFLDANRLTTADRSWREVGRNATRRKGRFRRWQTLDDTPRVGPSARGRRALPPRFMASESHRRAIGFSLLVLPRLSFWSYDCSFAQPSRVFALADSFIGISLPPSLIPPPPMCPFILRILLSLSSSSRLIFSYRVKYSR